MTPGSPWRRTWRETIVPILWLLAFAVLAGAALGTCIAHSTPDTPGENHYRKDRAA